MYQQEPATTLAVIEQTVGTLHVPAEARAILEQARAAEAAISPDLKDHIRQAQQAEIRAEAHRRAADLVEATIATRTRALESRLATVERQAAETGDSNPALTAALPATLAVIGTSEDEGAIAEALEAALLTGHGPSITALEATALPRLRERLKALEGGGAHGASKATTLRARVQDVSARVRAWHAAHPSALEQARELRVQMGRVRPTVARDWNIIERAYGLTTGGRR